MISPAPLLVVFYFLWRIILLTAYLAGAVGSIRAEYWYQRGSFATNAQVAVDALEQAGIAYPYLAIFRQAAALRIFQYVETVKFQPTLLPMAAAVLRGALADDPGSIELASRLLLIYHHAHRCEEAAEIAKLLMVLAPRNEKAVRLATAPCE